MGLFSHVDAAGMAEIAARFALGAVRDFRGIEAGTVNSNYALDAEAGRFFVRVNEGKAEDDVAYEAELVGWLAARGVSTPAPRPTREGAPYAKIDGVGLLTVFPWIDAAPLCARALTDADARACGVALARVHVAGAGFPRRRVSHYSFARIVLRHQGLPEKASGPIAAAIADTGDELAELAAARAAREALPGGIIHGDLFVDNVLRAADGGYVLLDFEQASDGALAYDLAVCLNAWGYSDRLEAGRVRALVDGYQSVRALGAEERAGLFREARAAAARFTITRLTDVELEPRATPLVKAKKDFRRYHARLLCWRALGEAGFRRMAGLA